MFSTIQFAFLEALPVAYVIILTALIWWAIFTAATTKRKDK